MSISLELDKFNTPHTGTTLRHPQNWLCRPQCQIPLQHLATTSPLGNTFWRHSCFSLKQPETQTNGDFNVYFLKWQTYLPHMSNDTRCFLHYRNSISSLYFFPFPTRLAAQTQTIFHAAIKNPDVKANGICLTSSSFINN